MLSSCLKLGVATSREIFIWFSCTKGNNDDMILTSVKIIKNEVGCRDDTVPKTVETRRHCEED